MGSDGAGVTTLVGFHGCPLKCKFCLNPECLNDGAKCLEMTPRELYDKIKPDHLYFLATGGGVTFGGGEPLNNSSFIKKFHEICPPEWKIYIETSLNVPSENVLEILTSADEFFVDPKDINPEIYRSYTGGDNTRVIENIKLILNKKGSDVLTVRLPLIKGYNTENNREKSETFLRSLGVKKFDKFNYIIKEQPL